MSRRNRKPAGWKTSWRDYDDRHFRSFPRWPSPLSLNPDQKVIEAAAQGDKYAREIATAWQLVVPVRVVEVIQ